MRVPPIQGDTIAVGMACRLYEYMRRDYGRHDAIHCWCGLLTLRVGEMRVQPTRDDKLWAQPVDSTSTRDASTANAVGMAGQLCEYASTANAKRYTVGTASRLYKYVR